MGRAAAGEPWDRIVPVFALPYAIWTLYVHAIVAAHASFATLLHGLPFVAAAALAATAGWFRLRDPATTHRAAVAGDPVAGGTAMHTRAFPLAVLALAMLWVGSLAAGLPYAWFWWVALLAMAWAWTRDLRGAPRGIPCAGHAGHPAWSVACVITAAIAVVLFANRPDADDAFHLSIPATLLRFPERPVLLHDTMYRLPDTPILLPFYRLANYDVLVAVCARLTGIDHLAVAYLLLPSLFAALAVLAWVYLLRQLVPARWAVVLPILFACVMLLGEAHRAYGNFAFVRLFQGKAILATCMVPAITGAALAYARHGGIRRWLLLFATLVAALGMAASAVFVAPAAAALGLAGGWTPRLVRSRRFVLGFLPTAYLFAAGWMVASGARGEQVLSVASPAPMPGVQDILVQTWGPWSTWLLLVALLAAWAFVRDPARARYFSAGAFFFLLVVLNPYTTPFMAEHSIGAKTYWRLTWALPLPFFLAVMLDGLLARAVAAKSKMLAAGACVALLALAGAFGWRSGTLRRANEVVIVPAGPKVPPVEYAVARQLARHLPETATVLAPEAVASWLPLFVSHPHPVGVRQMYLSLAFTPRETATRSNMMRYAAGRYRPDDAQAWFAESIARYRVKAVVLPRAARWNEEIKGVLLGQGWRLVSSGAYDVLMDGESAATAR